MTHASSTSTRCLRNATRESAVSWRRLPCACRTCARAQTRTCATQRDSTSDAHAQEPKTQTATPSASQRPAGFARESWPQLLVGCDRSPVPAKSLFVSSDRTGVRPLDREEVPSESAPGQHQHLDSSRLVPRHPHRGLRPRDGHLRPQDQPVARREWAGVRRRPWR